MTRPIVGRSLRVSVTANVVGRAYAAIGSVIFVPLYLHFLGIAHYGLFALLNSYLSLAALLDLGFSGAITRELAKLSTVAPQDMRDVVWTISIPYLSAAFLIGIGIYVASPWIAAIAISKGSGPPDPAVVRAVGLAGIALVLQPPIYLYTGGLSGIQRQDIANGVWIASTTLRHGGGLLLLMLVSNSVVTLMAWQATVAVLSLATMALALWRFLPPSQHRPRLRLALLAETWRFAANLGLQAALGTVAFAIQNAIVGALFPLTDVGHYMVACTVTFGLMLISQPITDAAFPRFVQLLAARNQSVLYDTLEKLTQLVVVMIVPLAVTFAVFPEALLFLWTANAAVSHAAAPYVRYLALGIECSAFSAVPFAFILAAGPATLLTLIVAVMSVLTPPAMYFGALHFGVMGAVTVTSVARLLSAVGTGALLASLLSAGELRRWLKFAIFVPQLVVGAIASLALLFAPHATNRIEMLALLSGTWVACTAAVGLAMPWTRNQGFFLWRRIRVRTSLLASRCLLPR